MSLADVATLEHYVAALESVGPYPVPRSTWMVDATNRRIVQDNGDWDLQTVIQLAESMDDRDCGRVLGFLTEMRRLLPALLAEVRMARADAAPEEAA